LHSTCLCDNSFEMFKSLKAKAEKISAITESKLNEVKTIVKANLKPEKEPHKEKLSDDLLNGWLCIGEKQSSVDMGKVEADIQGQDQIGSFTLLSKKIIWNILNFVDAYELCQTSVTCKFMNAITSDEFLWERLCVQDFGSYKEKVYSMWNSQKQCGGYKALYGTLYCEKRLDDTLLALSNTNNKKLEWLCKSVVSVQNFFVSSDVRIAIVGLDESGKSTILRRLLRGIVAFHEIGYSKERIKYKDYNFEIWDFDHTNDKSLSAWKSHLVDFKVVIYVVDSSNQSNIQQAGKEIQDLGMAGLLEEKPLLVYVNKRDAPNSLTTLQIILKMNLHTLFCNKGWHVQGCSAKDGFGIEEGLNWIVEKLQSEEVEKLQTKMK